MQNKLVEDLMKKVGLPFLVEFTSEREGKQALSLAMGENENVSFLMVPGKEGEKGDTVFIYDKTKTLDPTMKDVVRWTLGEMEKSQERKLTNQEVQDYCEQLINSNPPYSPKMKLAASEVLSEVNGTHVNKKKIKQVKKS